MCLSAGTFKLLIEFSEEYPNKPPTVRFVSRMFHPNGKFVAFRYLEASSSSSTKQNENINAAVVFLRTERAAQPLH